MTIRKAFFLFCVTLILSCAGAPPKPKTETPHLPFNERIQHLIQDAGCRMGIVAIDLNHGNRFEWNATEKFESASVIKIAILAEALSRWREGCLDLSERWFLTNTAKAAGSGVLDAFDPGLLPTNRDLLRLMIIVSDNTAANHWIDALGFAAINKRMEAEGLPEIRMVGNRLPNMSPLGTEETGWSGLRFGEVTPRAVAKYYELLATGKLLDPEATRLAREIFSQQHFTGRIPHRLLDNSGYKWEGKSGTLGDAILDSGILTTPKDSYVFAIFADHVADTSEASDKAVNAMGDIAYEIVNEWNQHN